MVDIRGNRIRQRRREIDRVFPGCTAIRRQSVRSYKNWLADAEVRTCDTIVLPKPLRSNIAIAVTERNRTVEIGADRIIRTIEKLIVNAFGEDITIIIADDDRRPHLRLAEIWIALLDFDMEVGVRGNGDVVETDKAVSAALSLACLKLVNAALVNREICLHRVPGCPVNPNLVGDIAD